jgi:VanZ family protein
MEQLRRQPSVSFLEGIPLSTAPLPSRRYRTVAGALCAVWLLAVAFIVLWPTPVDRAGGGGLRGVLGALHCHGLPALVSYGMVEFVANVVMFVPFGLFWFLLAPRGWRWAGALVGIGLSVLIEVTQLLLLPQRFATPYDVLANTLGTFMGTVAAWFLLRANHLQRSPKR